MRHRPLWPCTQVALALTCLLSVVSPGRARAEGPAEALALTAASQQVQRVVDRLRTELGIEHPVNATVFPQVALVMSVEAPQGDTRTFRLSVDQAFLERLSAEELDAAIAHELGHVWVFTHHPYLQTERLANQIAQRIVPRASLASVYHKLWEQGGVKGDLAAFLGPETTAKADR
jgi:hypothetical protein